MRHSLSLAVLLLLASPLLANGTIEVRGEPAGTVALARHAVAGTIRDQLAEVTVEQTFVPRGARQVEGVYVFALPPGASVAAFEMTVDGKTTRGEIVERAKARRIYEDIVSRKRDPALLEQIDHETFRARVFPLDPGREVAIRLVYQQLLTEHDGLLELRYPLARDRLGAADVARVDLRFAVESSVDLLDVASPSHALSVERDGKRRAIVSGGGGAEAQAKDLLLHVRRDPRAIGFTLLGDAPSRTFLAVLSPPARLPDEAIPPRDLVCVVDTSGSMEGEKLAHAKSALRRGIGLLRARDRFRILAFSSEVRPFRDGWTAATDEDKRAALAWIDGLEAGGGTAIDAALAAALARGDPERLGIVVFLTDGLPTVGETDAAKIVANVRARNAAAMRVFCFGVGFDQGVPFLDDVALATRAAREYVTQGQDLEAALVRFFDRVGQPALTDLRIEWGTGAREVHPNPLPDLFAGDPLVVAGRYDTPGAFVFELHGVRLGKPVTFVHEGSLPAEGGVPAVARLWAQRRIDFLLAEIRRNGEIAELEDEVVRLGTRHHIVTPYTAGLVVEDEVAESDGPFTNSAIGLGGSAGGGRRGRGGLRNAKAGGGSGLTQDAVELHLEWLAARRNADTGAIGGGEDTSLALLAMLGAGYTDRGSTKENRHAACVRDGLRFLMVSQDDDGWFAPRDSLRAHAIATLAVSEAYWITRNPRYKAPSQKGLDLLARARIPRGGWGDAARTGEEDVLTTVWAMLAFKAGKGGGLEVDPDGFEGARSLLDRRQGLLSPEEQAGALLVRILLGEDPGRSAALQALADALLGHLPPNREPSVDLWHFGTMAMFQVGGARWRRWNDAMVDSIVRGQRTQGWGDLAGTWPLAGERVGDQAKLAMCLEAYYRYDRVLGLGQPPISRATK